MPAALKLGGQEGLNDGRYPGTITLGGQAENIGVIVLARPLGGKGIVTVSCPYPPDLVGSDTHTNASAAY